MNKETNYWKTAKQMNGRLAMMSFFADDLIRKSASGQSDSFYE